LQLLPPGPPKGFINAPQQYVAEAATQCREIQLLCCQLFTTKRGDTLRLKLYFTPCTIKVIHSPLLLILKQKANLEPNVFFF
jgi:hypothetical protein